MLEAFYDTVGRVIRPIWRCMLIRFATGWRRIWRRVWPNSQADDLPSLSTPLLEPESFPNKRFHSSTPALELPPTPEEPIPVDPLAQHRAVFFETLESGCLSALQLTLGNVEPEVKAWLVESYNERGETALVVAIRRRDLSLVKYLMDDLKVDTCRIGNFTWNGVEYLDVPPLFMAIICADFYIFKYMLEYQHLNLVDERAGINEILASLQPSQEKINVLELLGATYIHHDLVHPRNNNQTTRRRGLQYWREAMNLRHPSSVEPPIPKILPQTSDISRKAMGFSFEITTPQELEQLDNANNNIQLFTQAIWAIQRIMGQLIPEPHSFTLYRLYTYAYEFYDAGQYSRVVNILMLMLEPFRQQPSDCWDINFSIIGALDIMNDSFKNLNKMPPLSQQGLEDFSFDNLMAAFDFAVVVNRQEMRRELAPAAKGRLDTCLYDIVLNLTEMLPKLSHEDGHRFKKALYHFIGTNHKFNYFDQGEILHVACRRSPLSLDLIQLLLDLGADANSVSAKGNTPLHLLAIINCQVWSPTITDAVQKLLDFGAHIDQPNQSGRRALGILKAKHRQLCLQGLPDVKLQSLLNSNVLPLTCLAAQVVRKNRIPFEDGQVPVNLHSFIRRH